MAVSPTTKAKLISARRLPDVVAAAVKVANDRHKVAEDRSPLVLRWELIGRILRDRNLAGDFAQTVSAEVAKTGIEVQPAVLIIDKDILAGFFERANVPIPREF
jgi:hypothetical protein